jgi:small subunit ribosomal protein S18
VEYIDFKNVNLLRNFISERGKIVSSRMTNVCTAHQRGLTRAIQLSRNIALLPFSVV